jgi:AcrR family transcriptional regulator
MNRRGLKGMTKAIIAERFGAGPSVLTYYFRTKEQIATACFERAIGRYIRIIDEAAKRDELSSRIVGLVSACSEMHREIAAGGAPAIVGFDDVRALGDQGVFDLYIEMFRHLRGLLQPDHAGRLERAVSISRTHFLLQQLVWMPVWLPRYNLEDYPRAAARMADILLYGVRTGSGDATPPRISFGDFTELSAAEHFLGTATRIINERGYFGASIDKISAELDVTKGAFYYHLDRKDALVEACFRRTIDIIRNTQTTADALPVNGCQRLMAAVTSLVTHQLDGGSPLLRAATSSLPESIKGAIIGEFDRNATHFGSMISDGIADGSIRPIDAQIGAHVVTAVINGSTELDQWLSDDTDVGGNQSYIMALARGVAG